jgi:hypothetical protein
MYAGQRLARVRQVPAGQHLDIAVRIGRSRCTTARRRPDPMDSSTLPSHTIQTPAVGPPVLNTTTPTPNSRTGSVMASAGRSSGHSGAAAARPTRRATHAACRIRASSSPLQAARIRLTWPAPGSRPTSMDSSCQPAGPRPDGTQPGCRSPPVAVEISGGRGEHGGQRGGGGQHPGQLPGRCLAMHQARSAVMR